MTFLATEGPGAWRPSPWAGGDMFDGGRKRRCEESRERERTREDEWEESEMEMALGESEILDRLGCGRGMEETIVSESTKVSVACVAGSGDWRTSFVRARVDICASCPERGKSVGRGRDRAF